jgi:hypothetical protein
MYGGSALNVKLKHHIFFSTYIFKKQRNIHIDTWFNVNVILNTVGIVYSNLIYQSYMFVCLDFHFCFFFKFVFYFTSLYFSFTKLRTVSWLKSIFCYVIIADIVKRRFYVDIVQTPNTLENIRSIKSYAYLFFQWSFKLLTALVTKKL